MKPQTAAALLARARAVLASGRPEMGEAMATSPVTRYLDPARVPRERALMRRHPQAVVAASALREPGSWWSGDVLGVPLLLTRDGAGALHAFLNVCRHRGARVVEAGQGCGRERFACPYHAWRYAADGRLCSVPRTEGFPGLALEQSGLRRLALAECAGMIWVIPDPACVDEDVRTTLGTFIDDLESFGLATHVAYASRTLELRCDWKLIVEGSSEAYHFKIAHRATIAPLFADNVQIVDEDGAHRRMFIVKEALRDQPAEAQPDPRAVGNVLYYFFPSTMVLIQPDHAQVTRIEPTALGHTQVHDVALIPEAPPNERARTHWDRNVQLYRDTLAEDYAQMESIQAGLASGANAELRFGRFEFALGRFHEQLDAVLAGSPA